MRPTPEMSAMLETLKGIDAGTDIPADLAARVDEFAKGMKVIDGRTSFKLYDTFGCPIEITMEMAKENGLSVDGQVGDQTLAALGIPSTGGGGGSRGGSYDGDVQLLARIISAEARGEPYQGQVAVGAVVLNRVKHPSFPDTLSGVIYQTDAFTAVSDGQFDKPIAESAYRAAQDALNGSDPSGGALYYFNPATATSAWIWSRPLIVTIGNHRFCA